MASLFSRCNRNLLFAALLASTIACSHRSRADASLVVTGARVWTGDPGMPWAEACGPALNIHAIDDGRWAEDVIGSEARATTYAFKSLIDSGAHLALGSDWYVAPADPIAGIYAAVTRRTLDGRNPEGWVPEQKITVEQALRGYTYEGAYASFDEDRKGTIRVGMLADMVLIDRDLTAIPPETLRDAKVLTTIVGGRVVFSR